MISEFDIEEHNTNIEYQNNEKESCCICLSPRNIEKYTCPNCKKKFHLICIIKWLNESSSCPMCRTPIKSIKFTDKIYRFNNFKNFDSIIGSEDIVNEDDIFENCCNYDNCNNICKCIFSISLSILILFLTAIIISSQLN